MRLFLLSVFLIISASCFAQVEREPLTTPDITEITTIRKKVIIGKIVEFGTNKPVQAASVQLFAIIRNAGKSDQDSLVNVTLSRQNGDFSIENIQPFDSLMLMVSSVGYHPEMHYLDRSDIGVIAQGRLDIGNIVLSREEQQLQGVVVTARRPQMQLGIDKKVFDATQSLTSKGGTAIDVMKNIPSLTVDVDGNVTFRDGSPTIYVDGRPTTLTLEQIPADNIDRVELISNPSAKYDASSGGGILNIILKKDKKSGFNGIVSLSGGVPGIFRSNGSLNMRQNKINVFVSGGYSTSAGEAKGNSSRMSRDKGTVTDYFNQTNTDDRHRQFKFIRGGLDYFIDNRNTVSLSQGYTQGNFSNDQNQDQRYLDATQALTRYGKRFSDDGFEFRRNTSQMSFTHKFPQDGHQLDASLTVNYGGVNSLSNIRNDFFAPDDSPLGDPQLVMNEGSNNNTQWTGQLDYANPISERTKIETGLRTYVNDYGSIFDSYNVSGGGKVKLPLSNHYSYQEQVHAAYFTFTDHLGNFGYQLGLRGEYSRFDGKLIDSATTFGYEYPSSLKHIWDALFPSVFLSQKLSEKDEIQLNYSRRINRPSFWQLNPFIDINDPQNIQQGNPALKPEFRNSLEFNYSKTYGSTNNNLLVTLYYRNTTGDITRYSDTITAAQYEKLQNSAVDPNAILNTFINANSVNNTGVEVTLKQTIMKGWDVTPSFSIFYRKVNAGIQNMDLSNEGSVWRTKVQSTYKFSPASEKSALNNFSIQLDGRYISPRVIPQGKMLENYSVDLALKKDIFKDNTGSIVFGVSDLFDSQKRGVIYDTPSFYQESYSRWRTRSFRLTFSYRFGNADFKLFNKNGGNSGNGGGNDFDN